MYELKNTVYVYHLALWSVQKFVCIRAVTIQYSIAIVGTMNENVYITVVTTKSRTSCN